MYIIKQTIIKQICISMVSSKRTIQMFITSNLKQLFHFNFTPKYVRNTSRLYLKALLIPVRYKPAVTVFTVALCKSPSVVCWVMWPACGVKVYIQYHLQIISWTATGSFQERLTGCLWLDFQRCSGSLLKQELASHSISEKHKVLGFFTQRKNKGTHTPRGSKIATI